MANTRTITLDGEHITVTRHRAYDYSIAFDVADFSVRGRMLDIVMTFAEWQASVMDEPVVSFEWLDRSISDPWLDPSARFPLDTIQATETYGEDNVLQFIADVCELIRPEESEV